MALILCLALALWSLGLAWDSWYFWVLIALWWAHGAACEMDGMFRGALGFYKLSEADKARAVALFKQLEKDSNS